MSDPTKPDEPGDDERWLDVLAGKRAPGAQDEKSAADLRQVLLDEYQQAYDEVDEVQLKRLERRIFAREAGAPASWRSRSFTSLQAIAASVASLAIGALLATAIVGPGKRAGTEGPELIMTYGVYEDMRGVEERTKARVAVADPNAVVDELVDVLTHESVPFRIYRLDDSGGRLLLIQPPLTISDAVDEVFKRLGIDPVAGAELELTIEKKSP